MSLSATPSTQLYLASASPRRRELLAQVGLVSQLLPQHVDESLLADEDANTYVLRLARLKAATALQDQGYQLPLPVLAADTTVVCDEQILGKPASFEDASRMLALLSGREHEVHTAVAVATPDLADAFVVSTKVYFRRLSEAEIKAYWATGEPCDKAGAYAVQGQGAMFVARLVGSYTNVVGLPLYETLQMLERFGISSLAILNEVAA